jgi:prepilin-type N-terminal cleavage/methylation domain-containing protein
MNKKIKLAYGFTLIELLVVVSIIALLSSLIMSSFGTAQQRGRDTSKIKALHEVQSALQLYVTDKKYYPATSNDLLTGKYIASIDPSIIYEGLNFNNTALCSIAPCQSYHLAVSLGGKDNKALNTDKDFNDRTFSVPGFINGAVDNCTDGTTSSVPDLCYDVMP